MRKASMILGIIGGVLAILVGLITLFGGMALTKGLSGVMQGVTETAVNSSDDITIEGLDDFEASLDEAEGALTNLVVLHATSTLIAGLAGLIGAIIVKKYNKVAGGAMILTAIILVSTAHILSFILLFLGGLLAFLKDKKATPDMEYGEMSFG